MGKDAWQIETQGTLAINQTYIFLLHHKLAHHKILAEKNLFAAQEEGFGAAVIG